MKKEFEMSEEQLQKLMDACRPVPCIIVGNSMPSSPQENANYAWESLGKEMGFDWQTVEPIQGKGNRFFLAMTLSDAKIL